MEKQPTIVDNLCQLRLKIGQLRTNSRVTIGDTKLTAMRKMKVHKDLIECEKEFVSLIGQLEAKDLPEMYRRMKYFAYDINEKVIEKLFTIINAEPIIIQVKKHYSHLHNTSAKLLLIKTYCRWRGRKHGQNRKAFRSLCEIANIQPEIWNLSLE
jgi:hypothetical protein